MQGVHQRLRFSGALSRLVAQAALPLNSSAHHTAERLCSSTPPWHALASRSDAESLPWLFGGPHGSAGVEAINAAGSRASSAWLPLATACRPLVTSSSVTSEMVIPCGTFRKQIHSSAVSNESDLATSGGTSSEEQGSVEGAQLELSVSDVLSRIRGIEPSIDKLAAGIPSIEVLLQDTKTVRLKKLGITCQQRKLVLRALEKWRAGIWDPASKNMI